MIRIHSLTTDVTVRDIAVFQAPAKGFYEISIESTLLDGLKDSLQSNSLQ